jgi:4'-phosphopantetheinyl transferase EntD
MAKVGDLGRAKRLDLCFGARAGLARLQDGFFVENFALRFLEPTSHGVVAGVNLPAATQSFAAPPSLTTEERDFVAALAPLRRASFVGGRVALRHAAKHLGWTLETVLSTERGAPAMPPGLIGSVAHKTRLAVALVDAAEGETVGVDLEELDRPRPKIARLVLRPEERAIVDALEPSRQWQAIATAFSIKEAIFKAIDPYVRRYVGFQEASVELQGSEQALVRLELAQGEGPFCLEARWSLVDGHVLSRVRARPR